MTPRLERPRPAAWRVAQACQPVHCPVAQAFQPVHRKPRPAQPGKAVPRQRGMTLVEVLLALALMALLFAAVATAMEGISSSYSQNEKIAQATQAARVVLHRLASEVRTADGIDSATNRLSIVPPPNAENVTRIDYELTDGTLWYRRTITGVPQPFSYSLIGPADGTEVHFTVSPPVTATDSNGAVYTVSTSITLTLNVGGNVISVRCTACPRRNLAF